MLLMTSNQRRLMKRRREFYQNNEQRPKKTIENRKRGKKFTKTITLTHMRIHSFTHFHNNTLRRKERGVQQKVVEDDHVFTSSVFVFYGVFYKIDIVHVMRQHDAVFLKLSL
ncbi:hypothetical protein DICVIV_06866 [Dictyocaulus viviparus]|uniref:Uncharacterized protein n=1 Tax=Dictyocaulus viviparus TaxID=29172 RepID=A0A0D8XTA8_DICVI|nr:hypothetical protein DICVIV_06866 [Dictyocaulus viviparus]